ncbi:HlyD family secretion protein [Rhodalgimonas zhirmunskyi]|uniref:HlyD family secretion protein n=1 Tax=Rhodalgimonas zhirmunskyi TaxID=2964767 RepID=A0AAJ1UGW1_9RHOB|nr:HlyD family secretion protein [Rhodoalgimonas zhirmunskyi]MDQ2095952.1 HlyD family secretion protein [Rhodoalgimonas zhirmunskyi]
MKKYIKPVLAGTVLLLIGAGLWGYWKYGELYPSTEDAYLKSNVIPIMAQTTGRVTRVAVTENQHVSAGDLLFEIDPTLYKDAVTQAEAQVAADKQAVDSYLRKVDAAAAGVTSALSAKDTADAQLERVKKLNGNGHASQATLDDALSAAARASAALDSAKAELLAARAAMEGNNDALVAAKAQLSTTQTNLERTKVTAPVSGWISNFALREGSIVTAYAPLFALVEDGDWWIDANFKETDLPRIQTGLPVSVSVDMLPDVTLNGYVASIGHGSGSTFSLLPAENASGNWVKVTQRFPVRIHLDPTDQPLRVGASSSVRIDTTAQPDPDFAKRAE